MPERDQLDLWAKSHGEAVTVENFLAWCEGQGWALHAYRDGRNTPDMVMEPRGAMLYRYFGVDPKRLEEQRRALLKETLDA